ncbi:MAG TPA: substrate-binding domain-containing protein [Anaerolineales bacterium]|nr:substrate-binding domain-containing protein [Anaerolineales bacterium]
MKKLHVLFATFLVLSLVLTACGGQQTPTEEVAPVATEEAVPSEAVPTEPEVTEPEVSEPAVTEGAAPAAEDKWCSGTNIVFFPGGAPGGPFETVVYNGAVAAATDLGPNVEYVWSDWNPEKMITQFSEAMATNPDGIAVMGHPGDEAFGPLVDEAESKGIVVTSMNTQLATLQGKYSSSGFGYVGAILYQAGWSLGKESVARAGLQAGDKAFVWGLLAQAGRGERTKGIVEALEDSGLEVIYQEIDDATNADAAAGVPVFVGMMSANPDIKLVVTDHGNLTGTQQTFFESAGLGPDDVYGAGFDLSSATVEAIRGGWTDLVIDQQQFLQGYMAVLQICLTHNYAFTGLHIDTGAGFAHKDNIEVLAALVEQQIR